MESVYGIIPTTSNQKPIDISPKKITFAKKINT